MIQRCNISLTLIIRNEDMLFSVVHLCTVPAVYPNKPILSAPIYNLPPGWLTLRKRRIGSKTRGRWTKVCSLRDTLIKLQPGWTCTMADPGSCDGSVVNAPSAGPWQGQAAPCHMRGPAESLRARMLFLDAGMYTAASWQSPQLLTGKLCQFCVILRSDACLDNALILFFFGFNSCFLSSRTRCGYFWFPEGRR